MSVVTLLGVIAATIVAVTVIGKALFATYRFVRRIDDANDIVKDLPQWQAKVNLAIKELHPNSGSSLKDQVTGIIGKQVDIETKVDCLTGTVDTLGNSLTEIHDMLQSHVADDQLHSQ